jgi:SAM-dependent methyltransferase
VPPDPTDAADAYLVSEITPEQAEVEVSRQKARIEMLQRTMQPGTLLDIGCGPGYLVKAAQTMGWRAAGCDISEGCCEFGREVLGVPLFAGTFQDLPSRSGIDHPDVITAFHVLEHLHEPLDFVKFADRTLKPGGLLVIEIPNLFSFESLLAGESWHGLALPAHVGFYTPESLRHLVEPMFRIDLIEYSIAPYFYENIEPYLKRVAVNADLIDRCARQFSGTAMVAYLVKQAPSPSEAQVKRPSLLRRAARRAARLVRPG